MPPIIRTVEARDRDVVAALLIEHFLQGSVLHQALNINRAQWRETIEPDIDQAIASGCSVLAHRDPQGEPVGCLVAWDAAPHSDADTTTTPTSAINALLQTLRQTAPIPHRGECIKVDMAVVAPEASGLGLYLAMREAVHQRARLRGYLSVRGELSSAATQHVCVTKLGQQVISEVQYADFHYQAAYPFAAITSPPSIQLVEGKL